MARPSSRLDPPHYPDIHLPRQVAESGPFTYELNVE
jgi:hypothetical protein